MRKSNSDSHIYENPRSSYITIILYVSFFILVILLIHQYYLRQKNNITNNIHKNLQTIAELKNKQIEDWRMERIIDAQTIISNPFTAEKINELNDFKIPDKNVINLREWFKILNEKYKNKCIKVVDKNGKVLMSEPESKSDEKSNIHFSDLVKNKQVILTDIHRIDENDSVHIDILIPVISPKSNSVEKIIIIERDPDVFLFPLIQSWPTDSKTAETLVFENDGYGNALYMNELKYKHNTSLNFVLSKENKEVLAIKALNGVEGITEGIDYRGVPVLGFITKVRDTKWYMVAKIDIDEAYEEINQLTLWFSLLLMLIIIASVTTISFQVKSSKSRQFQKLYQLEYEKKELLQNYKNVVENANDPITITDMEGNYIDVNEKFLSLYQYTKEEALKLNIRDIRAPESRNITDEDFKKFKQPGGYIFETIHIKKDGTIFPVEVSARMLEIEGEKYYQGIIRDISERKKAEKKLKESEELYKSMMEILPDGVAIHSEGRIVYINDFACKIMQIKNKEEAIGVPVLNFVHPDFRDIVSNRVRKSLAENSILEPLEEIFITPLGKTVNVSVTAIPFHYLGKLSMFTVFTDITEKKKAEETIRKRDNILKCAAFAAEQFLKTIDWESNILEVLKMLGVGTEVSRVYIFRNHQKADGTIITSQIYEWTEKDIIPQINNPDLQNFSFIESGFKRWVDVMQRGGFITGNVRDFPESEREILLSQQIKSILIVPIIIESKWWGFIGLDDCVNEHDWTSAEVNSLITTADILSAAIYRKLTLNALALSENKFKMIFDGASDTIVLLDKEIIIDCNKKIEDLTGYSKEHYINSSIFNLFLMNKAVEANTENTIREFIKSAYKGNTVNFEQKLSKNDGTFIHIDISLTSINIRNKSLLLGIIRDITERNKFQEGLKDAKEKAEEISRLKSSFLANMSHELRTPMTGILGFTEILNNNITDPENKQMAEIILKSSKRLMNTLNQILDLSRIEADKVDLRKKYVNVSLVSEHAAKLYLIVAKERNLELIINIEKNVYAMLDEQLLSQIVSNLIKNAIIYTKKGSVTIEVKKEQTGIGNFALIRIKDTGIGIPDNLKELIFEPFRQVSEGFSRDYEGTGLGLTLSKKYVEIMNGTIKVESKLDSGSEFTILFPLIPVSDIPVPETKPLLEEKKKTIDKFKNRVLIVEDEESSILAFEHILKEYADIDFFKNGEEAVEKAKNYKYDLIIMDIGLQGMSGLEATKEIRKLEGYADVPIIAVTAYAMAGDKEKFLSGGCSHYLSKPFKFSELRTLITKFLI
jgi:PAS domain S-box-containing protein